MKIRTVFLILLLGILNSSCKKNIDSITLCSEFYSLNKGKDFNGLYDVYIGFERTRSIYDQDMNQYDVIFNVVGIFDPKTEGYTNLPIFDRNSSKTVQYSVFIKNKSLIGRLLSDRCRVDNEAKQFTCYVDYVKMIYSKYDKIKTPALHNNKNVSLVGNPALGKFIMFNLNTTNNKCKVYYLAERNSLNQYWKKHFNEIKKLDENWYYEITP